MPSAADASLAPCPHGIRGCRCLTVLAWLEADVVYLLKRVYVAWAARTFNRFEFVPALPLEL